MNLYDEEQRKKDKIVSNKVNDIIVKLIIASIILIAILMISIYFLSKNPNKLTIKLDGVENANFNSIVNIEKNDDGTTEIYAPINEFAKLVGYNYASGEYIKASEDEDICSVVSKEEITIFYLNSNIIYKKDRTVENSDYEAYEIPQKVFEKDGELYVNQSGLQKGLNLSISYNEKNKELNIYTLDSMVEIAKKRATEVLKKESIDDTTFANKKAILDGMVVVIEKNELSIDPTEMQYSVININDGSDILSLKYEAITYIPQKSAFLIKKNNKVGIIGIDREIIIPANFDDLALIDKENELYLVKNNGLYGVINHNGGIILDIKYDQVGINIDDFEENGITSGYILLDEVIPVRQGEKWGLFSKNGRQITGINYDNIGSISVTRKSGTYNVIVIPTSKLIVVIKDEKYTFVNLNGNEIIKNVIDDVYMEISGGKAQYEIELIGHIYDAEQALKEYL